MLTLDGMEPARERHQEGTIMSKSTKQIYQWSGKDVTVSWDRRLCIHIGECTRAQGAVFESGRDPWAEPDRRPADEIEEVALRCPTGALVASRPGAGREPDSENTAMAVSCGPLYLRGDLEIDGASEDMLGVRSRAALCRCGASSNKPFCDNSHEDAGFRDRGAVGDSCTSAPPVAGKLRVSAAKDGPLLVQGPLSLLSGSGRPAWRGEKAAFCRCGASKSKPFCDGAHAEVGFRAD